MLLFILIMFSSQMNAPIIGFSWIKMTTKIYPFIRPTFVPKNGTVQLMICSTPSVYETNTKVISIKKCIKMYINVSFVYTVIFCVSFTQYQLFD